MPGDHRAPTVGVGGPPSGRMDELKIRGEGAAPTGVPLPQGCRSRSKSSRDAAQRNPGWLGDERFPYFAALHTGYH